MTPGQAETVRHSVASPTPMPQDVNAQIRAAAGLAIQQMIRDNGDNVFPWGDIQRGFEVNDQRIFFATRAAGIFKPKELTDNAALSIKTVTPSRTGRTAPYDDGELEDGVVNYRLQRNGEASVFNQHLLEACSRQVPLIYLRGLKDGLYEVFYPVFVEECSFQSGLARVVFDQAAPGLDARHSGFAEVPVQYSYGLQKNRLHQRAFRQRVLAAYGLRCALTSLPLVDLLEAAHIVGDSQGGVASVQNGIAMSTFHHTAYESNLMGIDPDGKIILSDQVRATRDGPMFSQGLLGIEGQRMRFPTYAGHRPNRDFLAQKFEAFTKAGR